MEAKQLRLTVVTPRGHLLHTGTDPKTRAPGIDRLGGKRWQTRRRKSQETIERMAEELLELYARRSTSEGRAFGPDSYNFV